METISQPLIILPDTGKELHAFGNVFSVKLNGEQAGELLSITTELTPPGGGPPLHVHSREDEIFLVIEGRINYFVAGKWVEVGSGGVVYLPRGVAHCYRNIGDTPSRHWIITSPAGFEKFLAASAGEFARLDGPDPDRIVAIHREHGINLLDEQKS